MPLRQILVSAAKAARTQPNNEKAMDPIVEEEKIRLTKASHFKLLVPTSSKAKGW